MSDFYLNAGDLQAMCVLCESGACKYVASSCFLKLNRHLRLKIHKFNVHFLLCY